MEQAVNTFQKGLRLDTHPMVQSNDSLSNALNGTFITMNGNEVILQNDMGNRRIDEAYLPPGYVPVGMKEYGGVIYVAAHNPLTHTDQIGSFPSPERNIGQEYPNLSTDIRNKFQDYFISHNNEVTVKINDNDQQNPDTERDIYLTNIESTLLPLTKERVLHAGDKFSIYFIDGDDTVPSSFDPEYISNYDNVEDNSDGSYTITFPDKQYTLYAGVLNSSNEFVDITPSLARWKDGDIITDIDDKPEEYKFNRGYFIPKKNTKEESVINTADDNNYLINRLTKAVNTYAYKLVGPLYLKIGLNTPETFDYEIKGEKGNNETYYVYITGVFTYNCPQPKLDFFSEHRRYDNESITENIIKDEINNVNILTYKRKCNLYLSSEAQREDYENYKEHYKYQIGVPTFNNVEQRNANKDNNSPQPSSGDSTQQYKDYYLQKFWYEGELNLNLFGTGLIDLQGWRFYNDWDEESDDADCYISCNFITYPKVDEEFSDLYVHFSTNKINVNGGGTIGENEWIKVSSIVGKIGSFRSTWKQLKLNPQQLYWVSFRYKSTKPNSNPEQQWKYLESKAFFLTTNLFNPCYIAGTEDYLDNFNKFSTALWSGEYSTNVARNAQETEIVNRYRKVIIYPQFNSNVGVSSNIDASKAKLIEKYSGESPGDDFPVTITTNYTLNCKINDDGLTYNKIKYPKNLITDESILDDPGVTPKYYIKHTGYTIGFEGNKDVIVNTVSRGGKDFTNDQSFTDENSYENSDNNNPHDSFSISLNEYLNSGTTTEFTIHNVFTTIGKAIKDQEDDENYKNIGFLLSFHPVDDQDDYKKINLLCLNNKQNTNSEQGGTYLDIVNYHKVNINCDMRYSSGNHYLDHDIKLNEQYRIEIDSARNDTNGYVHDYSHDDLDELSEKNILGKQNFSYLFIDANDDDARSLGDDSENYQRFAIKKSPKKTDGINNKDNTLLFWKGIDQTWYIYPRLLPYANTSSSLISKLGNLANLYYSYETSKTIGQDDKIEKHSLSNYIYTLPYSVNLDVEFDVKYTNNNINQINNSIELNYTDFGIFTKNVQNLEEPIVTPIELKANTLQNFIPSILSEVYSNLVLDDDNINLFGTFLDGNGKLLDEWKIYYKNGNKLYLTPNNDTFIVVPSQDEDYRLLSPKYPRSGSFEYNYLITGQGTNNDVDSNHTVRLSLRSGVYLSNEFQTYEDITRQNSNTESSNTTATGTQNNSTGIIPNIGGRTSGGGVLIDPGQPADYGDSSRHLDSNQNYYYS